MTTVEKTIWGLKDQSAETHLDQLALRAIFHWAHSVGFQGCLAQAGQATAINISRKIQKLTSMSSMPFEINNLVIEQTTSNGMDDKAIYLPVLHSCFAS
jgi:hypothetical protein